MICALVVLLAVDPLVVGLDHVPIAVKDLEKAVATYEALGFVIKPGREHENGIQNAHVKFPDGTELELISAPEETDYLTREYRKFLEKGEGPAFVSFYSPDFDQLSTALKNEKYEFASSAGLITFLADDPLRYIFFGKRNNSPTDKPEHFEHLNSALSLSRVWIAADDVVRERNLLRVLGAQLTFDRISTPQTFETTFEQFAEGQVVFFRRNFQTVKGRKVVGVTITVKDINRVKMWFGDVFAPYATIFKDSVLVRPEETHGLWIEFREQPKLRTSTLDQ